jgi:outer membrane protein assembly factor BamB
MRKLEYRELTALAGLAAKELRGQVPVRTAPPNISAWVSDITELKPAGVEIGAWRRACAIRALAANCPRQLGNELLLSLLRDPHTRSLPLADQLRIFEDAALLIDVWDDQGTLQRFVQCYHAAGQSAWEKSSAPPFSSIRHSLMTAPTTSRHQLEVATDEFLRREIAQLATLGDWSRLQRFARELRFFQLQAKAPLLDWSENLAIRKLPAGLGDGSLSKQKDEWRELLVEELSKEVYNSLAQLRVELSGVGREDAARVIASLGRQDESGVAPHGQDEHLLVSLSAAVREILENDPALRQRLANEYSEVARLRLRQAIDQRDEGAIEQIAWQFAGTDGASQAQEWLGDRALAAGQFALAWTHYRRGSSIFSPGLSGVQSPKLRLAAALAGRHAGDPLTGTIELGAQRMPAAEFESLIAELTARQTGEPRSRLVGVGPAGPENSLPPPSKMTVHRRTRLEGLVGNDPNREFTRDTARRQIDWVGRQLGIAVERHWMYACNRFQIAAYDLQAKQRVWQTPQPPGQIQFAQESTGIASRPLVANDRLYARLLFGAGGTLVCVDRANGQFVWTVATDSNESFISDPFWMPGESFLQCFQAIRTEQQEVLIRLVGLDSRTGQIWRTQEVMRLRDSWHRRRCCEVTPLDDGLVAQFAGVVVRLDYAGNVLWLRKHTVLPPDEDPQWISQWFQPPLVHGRHVVVAQPGCQSLDCLDLDSGRRVWSHVLLDAERIVGLAGGLLLQQTKGGLMGLHLDDGRTVWEAEVPDLLDGIAVSQEGSVVALQRVPLDVNRSRFRPHLLWLDAQSGTALGMTALPELEDADPRLGPLVSTGKQLWTFWGKGQTDPTRDVIELEPAGAAEGLAARLPESVWERYVDERLLKTAGATFPQWRLLHAEYGDPGALLPEVHGEKDVVQFQFRNSGPIVLGREFTFPDRGSPQLRFRFGNETGHSWKVEVRFRGEPVWSELITPQTHSQPWKSLAVDLRKLAGQDGWLTVRAWMPQGGDAPSYWKSLELVF